MLLAVPLVSEKLGVHLKERKGKGGVSARRCETTRTRRRERTYSLGGAVLGLLLLLDTVPVVLVRLVMSGVVGRLSHTSVLDALG